MTTPLGGLLVALATPFTADGGLDVEGLRALVNRTIDGGVHGVVACGSTGEFSALSGDERRTVVETVAEQAAGRVPVIAQTGATSTAEAIALSKHAQSVGADVVMPVAPYYEPLTLAETKHYLRTVAASVQIPVMLYNLPHATGVNLSADDVAGLAREVDTIQYVKNTTPDMAQAAELIAHSDVVATFIGWDSLAFSAILSGAAGFMAGTANVIPAELRAVWDAVRSGDLEDARAKWSQVYPLLDAALNMPYVTAVKTAMEAVGHCAGPVREPLLPLSDDEARQISQLASAFAVAAV